MRDFITVLAGGAPLGALTVLALAALLAGSGSVAGEGYPDWRGQWVRVDGGHGPQFDPSKPPGRGQQVPLTVEYQSIFEGNLRNLASGTQPYNPQLGCLPPGMPRAMILYEPMEIIVTPATTYLILTFMGDLRRIYSDGRDWPATIGASFLGYSIGKWIDTGHSGRYDLLEIETRHIKGPRSLGVGIPLHQDNMTVVKERLYLDPGNSDIMRDEVTTIDHAFMRPWTVLMTYRREHGPIWSEFVCAENNNHVVIGKDTYFMSVDRQLMPTRKGQSPPDLRNFHQN